MYLEKFILPDVDLEERIAEIKMRENGGEFGYLDNGYPCGLFTSIGLTEIDFEKVTIICGGNGSGKSTLLNVIAQKFQLKRMSPFNDSELFSLYANACAFRLAV